MSTQEPAYETTSERLRGVAINAETRERLASLAARYWEIAAYAFLALSAGVFRFWNLGDRAMHHDESLHGYFAYGFNKGLDQFFTFGTANIDTYKHVPFMHGPWQFISSGFVMWIFGDGEFQSRIVAATMGTALVAMPYLLRKQLGTIGALMAALFLAISPMLMYYSRFTREDIYTGFWTLGIVIFMWRYLTSQDNKWLFLTTAFMALSFATKETTFFTVGAFLFFLDYMLARHIADKIRAKANLDTPLYVVVTLALLPVAWAFAAAWPFIEDWRRKYDLDTLPPEGGLLVVMGTLAIPQYAAAIQFILGDTWQDRAYEGSDFHVHPDESGLAYAVIFLLIAAASVIGLLWNPRVWLIAAAAFWVPFVLLYTTFFSNPEGFFSGMWGSLDYWLSQQDVRRGDQPDYYYVMTISIYEFLPLALSIAALLYYMIRGRASHALFVGAGVLAIVFLMLLPHGPGFHGCTVGVNDCKAGDGSNGVSYTHVILPFTIALIGVLSFPINAFNRFLLFWLVSTAFALTVAGEKMPWLNVHIAIPLAILAGRFVGEVLSSSDLREDLPKVERLAPFAYAALAAGASVAVFVVVGPFSGASFGAWALAAVAAVSVYWAFTSYSRTTALQVAVVGVVAAFSVFSFRAAILASWGHPDSPYKGDVATRDYGEVPVEALVYTQTSGDIPVLRDKIDQLARESGQGENLPIVVDATDGYTWPWAWYLRNYKSVQYPTITEDFDPPENAVLLVAKGNETKLNLGGEYEAGIPYHHRRWFPESYRGANGMYSSQTFLKDLFSPDAWSERIDYWIRKEPPGTIGSADAVAFFPKGFQAVPPKPVGPTVRTEGTQLVIGGAGNAEGQLSGPSDVALDAEGNIYVADTNNNRIEKYNAQGVFQAAAGGFSSDVKFNQPWSLAVAPDGTVFVANTWDHQVVKLDRDLNHVKTWGVGGQAKDTNGDPTTLYGPRDIIVLPNGNVLLSDTGNGRLVEFTAEGDPVRQYGHNGWKEGETQFSEPVGLAVDANGDIYVADFWNKRILVLDSNLLEKRQIDVPSWGSNAVTDRAYVAVLADGRILATDPQNQRILVFSAEGQEIGSFAVPVEGSNPTSRPVGIATDGTSVLVVDAAGSVVRKIPLGEVAP